MIFVMFLAVCWGCEWLFTHSHPVLGVLAGVLFAVVYFIDRWFDLQEFSDDEDSGEVEIVRSAFRDYIANHTNDRFVPHGDMENKIVYDEMDKWIETAREAHDEQD